jgi:hypothetical protein
VSLTDRTGMRKCGKRYTTREEALNSKRGHGGGYEPQDCLCGSWHLRRIPMGTRTVKPAATQETGFSREVRAQIRTRAGGGVIEDAHCEACGTWLGRYGGQCQHIVARGKGGSKDPVINSAVNGALLCGTSLTGCHGLCEDRDERMHAEGFWLEHGQDPAAEPFLWHSPGDGSGIRKWRTADGGYSDTLPVGVAA